MLMRTIGMRSSCHLSVLTSINSGGQVSTIVVLVMTVLLARAFALLGLLDRVELSKLPIVSSNSVLLELTLFFLNSLLGKPLDSRPDFLFALSDLSQALLSILLWLGF